MIQRFNSLSADNKIQLESQRVYFIGQFSGDANGLRAKYHVLRSYHLILAINVIEDNGHVHLAYQPDSWNVFNCIRNAELHRMVA